MIFDSSDILKQLEAGKSVDELATEAATAINTALKFQQEKIQKAKLKANKENKIKDLADIVVMGFDYLNQYYPKLLEDTNTGEPCKITDEDSKELAEILVDAFDNAYEQTFKNLDMLKGLFDLETKKTPIKLNDPSTKWTISFKNKDDEDAIKKFLKDNGLN